MRPARLRRRAVLGTLAAATVALPEAGLLAGPPVQIPTDYARAREGFRTRLLTEGPAPEPGGSLKPPDGVQAVPYPSGELTLVAWASPPRQRPGPAVLILHGGNALGPGHWDMARPFLAAGYAVMMPALRGENGLPGSFSGFYDETQDVLAASHLLAARDDVDPDLIFLAGHSIGATQAMLAALTTTRYRRCAAFSGNPDARAFFKRFPEEQRFDPADPREFQMRSPACFATSFKCPIMLLHGTAEAKLAPANLLTRTRAAQSGLYAIYDTVEGDHGSAIPSEIELALRFFAEA